MTQPVFSIGPELRRPPPAALSGTPGTRHRPLSVRAAALPFRARLVHGLIKVSRPTARHLRALEHLLLRLFTATDPVTGATSVLPEDQIDVLLARIALTDGESGSEAGLKQYLALTEEVLMTRSFAELEQKELLKRARALKYELGHRYIRREVVKAAVLCLLVIERLAADPGYSAHPELELRDWRRGRLPLEPPTASGAARGPAAERSSEELPFEPGVSDEREEVAASPERAEEDAPPPDVPFELSSNALENEAAMTGGPPRTLRERPATRPMRGATAGTEERLEQATFSGEHGLSAGPDGAQAPDEATEAAARPGSRCRLRVEPPPWEAGRETASARERGSEASPAAPIRPIPAAAIRGRARPALTGRKEGQRSRDRARPAANPQPVPSSGSRSPFLTAFTLTNLLFIAFLGVRMVLEPPVRIQEDPAAYQAYAINPGWGGPPIASARRMGDVLVLTAGKEWLELAGNSRRDLVNHLTRHLIGRESIERLLIVSGAGQPLAYASREGLEVASAAP